MTQNPPGSFSFGSFGSYDGDWLDGRMHGQGTFRLPDGSVYKGSFVHGEICGEGERRYPSGDRYCGTFLNGEPHGHGVFTSADGKRQYDGEWVQAVRQGTATLKYIGDDGQQHCFSGSIDSGLPHGKGREETSDGVVYEGQFNRGERSGFGRITFRAGQWYEGQFVANRQHGQGTAFHAPSGIRWEGEWIKGAKTEQPAALAAAGSITCHDRTTDESTAWRDVLAVSTQLPPLEIEVRSTKGGVLQSESGRLLRMVSVHVIHPFIQTATVVEFPKTEVFDHDTLSSAGALPTDAPPPTKDPSPKKPKEAKSTRKSIKPLGNRAKHSTSTASLSNLPPPAQQPVAPVPDSTEMPVTDHPTCTPPKRTPLLLGPATAFPPVYVVTVRTSHGRATLPTVALSLPSGTGIEVVIRDVTKNADVLDTIILRLRVAEL